MRQKAKFSNLVLLGLLLWSFGSVAQQNTKASQFGIAYGYSVPDADNTKAFHLGGVKGTAFLSPKFSFGGYYLVSDSAGQPSSTDKFSYSLHGLEATYHFGGASGDTFTGFRVGMSKVSQNPGGTDVTFSPYHYGIASGHDFHIGNYFSVGIEGSYIYVEKGRTTHSGTIYERDSFSVLSFLIALQLRL